MNIYGILSFSAGIIYLYCGFYVFFLDRKSTQNRAFMILFQCFFIWAISFALMINSDNGKSAWQWERLEVIAIYTFCGAVLHFTLALTQKHQLLKKWWIYLICYFPALLFTIKLLSENYYEGKLVRYYFGWGTYNNFEPFWGYFNVTYYFGYSVASLFISLMWVRKMKNSSLKKEGIIGILGASLTVTAIVVFEFVMPNVFKIDTRVITPLSMLIWAFSVVYGIKKYHTLLITPTLAAENIFRTLADSIILTDKEGEIRKLNFGTEKITGFTEKELIGKPFDVLLFDKESFQIKTFLQSLENGSITNYETYFMNPLGESIPIMMSASEVRGNRDELVGYVMISKDIKEYKLAKERLEYLANHDALTTLPNRLLVYEKLNIALREAKEKEKIVSVIMLDLDKFKDVNDLLGHIIGDELLKEVARRLKTVLYINDMVARLGGDEFIVVLCQVTKTEDIEIVAEKIKKIFEDPVRVEGHEINISCSLGISQYPSDGSDVQTLIKNADLALYQAKNSGRNSYQFYHP